MLVEGQPGKSFASPVDRGSEEVWTGQVHWPSGAQFRGQLRGLRPVSGVETDANGKKWDILYNRNSGTLGETLLPAMRPVMLMMIGWFTGKPEIIFVF